MFNLKTQQIIIILLLLIIITLFYKKKQQISLDLTNPLHPKLEEPQDNEKPIQLTWTEYPPIRSFFDPNLGKVLSDIESHMPANHIYKFPNDKVTWAHETTHGINSNIRNKYQIHNAIRKVLFLKRINGFYCLNNKAIIVTNPENVTMSDIARKIPQSLQGDVYNLYFHKYDRGFEHDPTYVFDEWSAYVNGAECRQELKISNRAETLQYAIEFNIYALVTAQLAQTNDPQFKNFIQWMIERTTNLYQTNGEIEKVEIYLDKLRNSNDAKDLRQFCQVYYGEKWCKEILGF